jgi:hypothetical protein
MRFNFTISSPLQICKNTRVIRRHQLVRIAICQHNRQTIPQWYKHQHNANAHKQRRARSHTPREPHCEENVKRHHESPLVRRQRLQRRVKYSHAVGRLHAAARRHIKHVLAQPMPQDLAKEVHRHVRVVAKQLGRHWYETAVRATRAGAAESCRAAACDPATHAVLPVGERQQTKREAGVVRMQHLSTRRCSRCALSSTSLTRARGTRARSTSRCARRAARHRSPQLADRRPSETAPAVAPTRRRRASAPRRADSDSVEASSVASLLGRIVRLDYDARMQIGVKRRAQAHQLHVLLAHRRRPERRARQAESRCAQ